MPFDQKSYTEAWKKENMRCVTVRYKKEFVEEFRVALASLKISQSDLFREVMQKTINKAKKLNEAKQIK